MTTAASALAALGRERYVRLTTFRRDGTPVATPVWVAADETDPAVLWVTTSTETGKVKRLRRTPRAVLVACDARGRVSPGSPEVQVVGEVRQDPASTAAVRRRITAKYRIAARVAGVVFGVRALLGRLRGRPAPEGAALRLSAPVT